MKVIGLTGGIASGKTTVSNYLRELGAVIIDTDILAREIVEPGTPAWQEIVDYFGPGVLTPEGNLDRLALGQIVFSNPVAREKLNQMTHPRIKEKTREQLDHLAMERPETVAVVDAPLLIEASFTTLVDQIWLVAVDEQTQIARLKTRNGMSEEEARSRIASQMALSEKLKLADKVIDNSGSLAATLSQVRGLWDELNREH
ncbi:MAG: dephospho-CoA kinase [Syntrophomonadaceae bacterium]|nr:dephospho-CoA kinase [Syntrophomonadaceae bacterium]